MSDSTQDLVERLEGLAGECHHDLSNFGTEFSLGHGWEIWADTKYGSRICLAESMTHARADLVAALCGNLPAILTALRSHKVLVEALERYSPQRIGHGPSTYMTMLAEAHAFARQALSSLDGRE